MKPKKIKIKIKIMFGKNWPVEEEHSRVGTMIDSHTHTHAYIHIKIIFE